MSNKLQFVLYCLALLCLPTVLVTVAAVQQSAAPQAAAPVNPQPVARRGTIKGRVLGDDGQPLAEAPVVATPIGRSAAARRPGTAGLAGAPSQTTTDEEGNFTFENLIPASYSISATVPGYIAPPAEEETGAGIYRLGDSANITLVKGGVITGKVTNALGDPLTGVSVSAIRIGDANGEEDGDLVPQGFGQQGAGRNWRTDDRGVYRIYGLVPGTYIVQAGAPGGGRGGFGPNFPSPYNEDAPTYYPSNVRDTAVALGVVAGGELSGIDIRYRGEKGRVVSGKVLAKTGENPTGFNATIITLSLPGTDDVVATTIQMNGGPGGPGGPGGRPNRVSDGGFALHGIPDGEYEISARRNGMASGDSDSVAAPQRVSVHGVDAGGIQLTLAPLALVSGKVVMERRPGICPLPRRAFIEEVLLSTQRDETKAQEAPTFGRFAVRPAAPLATGEFTLRNLEAGRWRILAQMPDENWFLRAINADSKAPATAARKTATPTVPLNPARNGLTLKAGEKQSGVIVTLAEGAAAMKGKVASETGKAISKVRVHLVPAEKEAVDDVLRYAETTATTDGSFHFKNLAPGRYYLLSQPFKDHALVRPAAWDNVQRTALRKEAEAAGNIVELKTCQRLSEYKLSLK